MRFLSICNCIALLLFIACSEAQDQAEQQSGQSDEACMICHGDSNAAPPKALDGSESTSSRGVGAHQIHLNPANAVQVACGECHLPVAQINDPNHLDGDNRAEVVFGNLAKQGGLTPSWDGTSCSNSYCHGATLQGGSITQPTWTQVDGSQKQCGACHGMPPSAPHPQVATCENCHGVFDGTKHHINGTVEVDDPLACNACHGNANNPAPPLGLSGQTATTNIGVGAHQAHLQDLTISAPVACSNCHAVPATLNSPGHIENSDNRAEVIFSGLAIPTSLTPTWDGVSCSTTYCHGANLLGGDNKNPPWNIVDGSMKQCGSCHGNPPAWHYNHWAHPDSCQSCHGMVVTGTTITTPSLHINGVKNSNIDTASQCNNACHSY